MPPLYALGMSAFLYTYYAIIDPTYFDAQLSMVDESTMGTVAEKAENLENYKKQREFVTSPYFNSTISLVGFLILGSFYSALIAYLVRKFSGFRR